MDGEIKGCGVPKLDRSTKPAKGTISHMDGRTQSYRRPFRRLPAGKAARSAAKTIPRIQNSDPRDIDAVFRPVKALFLFCGAVGGSNSAFFARYRHGRPNVHADNGMNESRISRGGCPVQKRPETSNKIIKAARDDSGHTFASFLRSCPSGATAHFTV